MAICHRYLGPLSPSSLFWIIFPDSCPTALCCSSPESWTRYCRGGGTTAGSHDDGTQQDHHEHLYGHSPLERQHLDLRHAVLTQTFSQGCSAVCSDPCRPLYPQYCLLGNGDVNEKYSIHFSHESDASLECDGWLCCSRFHHARIDHRS